MKPTKKDARDKAKQIIKTLDKQDPTHLYAIKHVEVDLVKGEHKEKKWYLRIDSILYYETLFFFYLV
jgi:hypothetical protein